MSSKMTTTLLIAIVHIGFITVAALISGKTGYSWVVGAILGWILPCASISVGIVMVMGFKTVVGRLHRQQLE